VHWVLWQNRIATIWAAWLRMHETKWMSPLSTYATLGIEALLPGLLLLPVLQRWTRRVAIVAIWLLHGSIALMMTLGPFSYSMMAFSLLLIGRADWELAGKLWRKPRPTVQVLYDPTSGFHHQLARLLARLDSRARLAFADIRDPIPLPIDAPPAAVAAGSFPLVAVDVRGDPGLLFAVRGKEAFPWETGAASLARAVAALPGGFALAWCLRLPSMGRRIEQALQRRSPAKTGEPSATESPAAAFARALNVAFGQGLACVLLATIVLQLGSDNWVIPDKYRIKRRPEFMRELVEYLRLPQGWSMFSPEAPRDDGTIVIDAVLSDGRHIDPRKQRSPDFEAAFHGPWFDDQQWCDWDLRMRWDSSRHFYPYFRDYIARLDRMKSWKQDARIQYFDVYWVNNAAPPRGSTRPYDLKKQLLFSGGVRP
jgi:hypothetical protein